MDNEYKIVADGNGYWADINGEAWIDPIPWHRSNRYGWVDMLTAVLVATIE